MIDTHVHLDHEAFTEGPERVWAEARAAGVEGALLVAVEPSMWPRTIALAARLEGVELALGIHPQVVPGLDDETLDRALAELPARVRETGAVAIGECGLDGPAGDLDRQERVLRAHLALARALALPVSLHVFKVHGRALAILRDVGALPRGGVLHSYSGSAELVRDYVALGWSVGFAGAITRDNAKRPVLAARAVPRDRLVVETDAPFQPTGADARDRGRGDPRDLRDVVRAVAEARGESEDDVAALTTENARRLFGFAAPPRRP